MVFVDTSVWVAALRGGAKSPGEHLRTLLDADEVALAAPVRIEILSGASTRDRARLRRVLSALPAFYPTEPTWGMVEAWVERAGAAGERFGVADLLIAASAAEHGGSLWSLDRDFARMRALGFVTLHEVG